MASISSSPRTVEEIFKDFSARRAGIVRALTQDVDEFYGLCDPAFYFGAQINRNERKRLFSLINDLPTVFEVVTERKPVKDKPSADSGSRSRGSTKALSLGRVFGSAMPGKITELPPPKMGPGRPEGSSKERLKWTQELHNLFEKAVNQLGGPERATPKGILKVMGIPGLTIYHVKSHLQKYRMSKFVPEDPITGGKFEMRSISEILPNFSATSGAQLNEALQIQMNVYKRLSDQHEVQRSLKMKMEAQGRFLERIMEEHRMKATCSSSSKPSCKSYSPMSLPSLCDESESNVKDIESDSEVVDKNEIRSNELFPQRKRIRFDEEVMSQTYSFASPSGSSLINNLQLPFSGMEMNNIPWSLMSYQSPMLPAAMFDSLI
nr:myb family transcription factor PHL7-like [Ipomoea batatas]